MITIRYNDKKTKHLEAMTVCVNYSDYLKHFLHHNTQHFNKLTVVTTKEDKSTINLCNKQNVQYVFTHRLTEHGAKFNKGKAINDGLASMKMEDWILIIDSDIILPYNFKSIFNKTHLKKDCLYGVLRHNCRDKQEWENYYKLTEDEIAHRRKLFSRTKKGKYKKIVGYFQLFNTAFFKGEKQIYPEHSPRANVSDRVFFRKWKYDKRHFLEDAYAVHLSHGERENANWEGRKTKFGF